MGGIVFFVDLGSFHLFIVNGFYRPLAATFSYCLAILLHFTLNKFLNFKNFERSTVSQFTTYLVVVSFSWVLTLLIIEVGVRLLRLTPVEAKLVAIAVNIPIGFLGHRFLTFGSGIKVLLRQWQHLWLKRQ